MLFWALFINGLNTLPGAKPNNGSKSDIAGQFNTPPLNQNGPGGEFPQDILSWT